MTDNSIFQKLSSQFSQGWKLLIQPHKLEYTPEDLGKSVLVLYGAKYNRHDYSVDNRRGHRLECSFYECTEIIGQKKDDYYGGNGSTQGGSSSYSSEFGSGLGGYSNGLSKTNEEWTFGNLKKRPVLVYCHSQTGCKLEGKYLIDYCARKHMGLLLYDSAGCGRSEGEYVTLGWHERKDLAIIISELKQRFNVGPVSIWGRSMGAVTAIMYAERNSKEINSMVLDSPFADLKEMVKEIGSTQFKLPGVVMNVVIKMFSGIIKKKIGIDIFELKPGRFAQKVDVPAFFIVGKNDKLLPKSCVMDIYRKYKAKKKVIVHSEANHSDEREIHIINDAFDHICDELSKTVYKGLSQQNMSKRKKKTKNQDFFDPFFSPNDQRNAQRDRQIGSVANISIKNKDKRPRNTNNSRGGQATGRGRDPSRNESMARNDKSLNRNQGIRSSRNVRTSMMSNASYNSKNPISQAKNRFSGNFNHLTQSREATSRSPNQVSDAMRRASNSRLQNQSFNKNMSHNRSYSNFQSPPQNQVAVNRMNTVESINKFNPNPLSNQFTPNKTYQKTKDEYKRARGNKIFDEHRDSTHLPLADIKKSQVMRSANGFDMNKKLKKNFKSLMFPNMMNQNANQMSNQASNNNLNSSKQGHFMPLTARHLKRENPKHRRQNNSGVGQKRNSSVNNQNFHNTKGYQFKSMAHTNDPLMDFQGIQPNKDNNQKTARLNKSKSGFIFDDIVTEEKQVSSVRTIGHHNMMSEFNKRPKMSLPPDTSKLRRDFMNYQREKKDKESSQGPLRAKKDSNLTNPEDPPMNNFLQSNKQKQRPRRKSPPRSPLMGNTSMRESKNPTKKSPLATNFSKKSEKNDLYFTKNYGNSAFNNSRAKNKANKKDRSKNQSQNQELNHPFSHINIKEKKERKNNSMSIESFNNFFATNPVKQQSQQNHLRANKSGFHMKPQFHKQQMGNNQAKPSKRGNHSRTETSQNHDRKTSLGKVEDYISSLKQKLQESRKRTGINNKKFPSKGTKFNSNVGNKDTTTTHDSHYVNHKRTKTSAYESPVPNMSKLKRKKTTNSRSINFANNSQGHAFTPQAPTYQKGNNNKGSIQSSNYNPQGHNSRSQSTQRQAQSFHNRNFFHTQQQIPHPSHQQQSQHMQNSLKLQQQNPYFPNQGNNQKQQMTNRRQTDQNSPGFFTPNMNSHSNSKISKPRNSRNQVSGQKKGHNTSRALNNKYRNSGILNSNFTKNANGISSMRENRKNTGMNLNMGSRGNSNHQSFYKNRPNLPQNYNNFGYRGGTNGSNRVSFNNRGEMRPRLLQKLKNGRGNRKTFA